MTNPAADDMARMMHRIAVRRRALGLSQGRAAAELGLSQGTASHWEAGRRVPPATELARYARLVGLRLALVGDERTAMACLTPDDPALPDEPELCDDERSE